MAIAESRLVIGGINGATGAYVVELDQWGFVGEDVTKIKIFEFLVKNLTLSRAHGGFLEQIGGNSEFKNE